MTLEDPEFTQDFTQLTKNELGRQREVLTEEQVSKLLEAASLFALNRQDMYQKLAFKIAIYLLSQHKTKYPFLPLAVEIIVTRLGDLPTIRSMIDNEDAQDYFSYFGDEELDCDTLITHLRFPEILIKKLTNQIEVPDRRPLILTDFQSEIYNLLKERHNVAFSAPTSAGKSYVIYNYIAERVSRSNEFCAVYIVPTKALIAEVQAEIARIITDSGVKSSDFSVFISANYLNLREVKRTPKKVFVLTQERLQEAMANNPLLNVNLLVLDEAQKISDEGRGVIIEDAVQELLLKNPTIQKVFISPYIQDPERFKSIFDIPDEIVSEKTSKSPVGQSILSIDFEGPKASISLLSHELRTSNGSNLVHLYEIPLAPIPSSHAQRKAWVAKYLIPPNEPTLIYCDRPSDCRRVAKHIASESIAPDLSAELNKAIHFFAYYVHEDYYLVDSLRNRIGYHYGRMPQFVRFYVKNLFENKEIDLLCCTSTLLEGVNLPAKNIILYNPKAGQVMDRLSLLNLAGRAGRLLKDYYGKIYCINMKDWVRGEDVFQDRLENIESSVEETLKENAHSLIKYLENYENPASESVKALATSLIMKQLRNPDSRFLTNYRNRYEEISQANLDAIRDLLVKIASQVSVLDRNVILKNRSIDPRYQYELYQKLKRYGFEPAPSPEDPEFYGKLCSIFSQISQFILRERNRSYVYYSYLGQQWISQKPYRSLIQGKINHGKIKPREAYKDFVNRMIDDLDDDLETKLKHDYTRGLKCYIDIAQEIMREKGDTRPVCRELPIFLEAGASNRNVLSLLEAGLSRNVALGIESLMDVEIKSIADCIQWLKANKTVIKERVPEMLYREIEALLSKYEVSQV